MCKRCGVPLPTEAHPTLLQEPARAPSALKAETPRLGRVGLVIYNLLYWPYLLGSCVVLFWGALLIFMLTFWDARRRLLNAYTRMWGKHYLSCAPFAGITLEGSEHVQHLERCIYVANHQSMVDILA